MILFSHFAHFMEETSTNLTLQYPDPEIVLITTAPSTTTAAPTTTAPPATAATSTTEDIYLPTTAGEGKTSSDPSIHYT